MSKRGAEVNRVKLAITLEAQGFAVAKDYFMMRGAWLQGEDP